MTTSRCSRTVGEAFLVELQKLAEQAQVLSEA
jgi:hypothetical protein